MQHTYQVARIRDFFPRCLLGGLVCLMLCGCDSDSGALVVSGAISYDGEPLTNGTIGFISESAGEATRAGTTIAAGRYQLDGSEGLQPGQYQVVIYSKRPTGRKMEADEGSSEMIDQMVQYIPPIYNSRTTLSVDIAGNRDDLNFDLEKPTKSKRRR